MIRSKLFPLAACFLLATLTALFVACSGESEPAEKDSSAAPDSKASQSSSAQKDDASSAKEPKSGMDAGTVTLQYGDETKEIQKFKEMGTDLLLTAGTVSLSLVTLDGGKISVGFQAKDGAPMTGEFAPRTSGESNEKRVIQLSLAGIIGSGPGLRLSDGTVTIRKCDVQGNFVAEFSGEAVSMNPTVEGSKPFSGTIDVKVPVIQR